MKVSVDITAAVTKLVGSHAGLTEGEAASLVQEEILGSVGSLTAGALSTDFYVIEGQASDGTWSVVGAQPAGRFSGVIDLIDFVLSAYSYTNSVSYRATPTGLTGEEPYEFGNQPVPQ